VVAADDGRGLQGPDTIDDRVGLRAVADEIAEHDRAIPASLGVLEDGVERVDVGVDVREDEVAHLSADPEMVEDALDDFFRRRGGLDAQVRLQVRGLPEREEALHLRAVR